MNNFEIRTTAKRYGIRFWEIANELGVQDSAFSRKLRKELPMKEKENIIKIIEKLAAQSAEVF